MEYKLFYARIYRIRCGITGEAYIGSTTKKLKIRLSEHKSECKRKAKLGTTSSSCYDIIMRGDPIIECLYQGYFFSKNHLKKVERSYTESMPCVNVRRPILTNDEKIAKFKDLHCKFCHKCLSD